MNLTDPRLVLSTFLAAFQRLDLDVMLTCFAETASAFFPAEYRPARLVGKEEIGRAFAAVIANWRLQGKTSVPLEARDLQMQEMGDMALATFHLKGEHWGRRSFVMHRTGGEWRIVHMHASNAPLDD
jgi:ketosteroid isomerase-like protein